MTISSFEIRVCVSCGLRFPLTEGHSFGVRCPHCLGETRVVIKKKIARESAPKEESKLKEVRAVLLDNIRSAWNVGSILRSADGFGFSHVYLCGITPTPELDAVRKTALGADEHVTWSHHKDAVKLVQELKEAGWKIYALEEDERSQPLSQTSATTSPTMLILGSEVTGVDPDLLNLADNIFHIPMRGQKRSFNVANAFSIAAYVFVERQ